MKKIIFIGYFYNLREVCDIQKFECFLLLNFFFKSLKQYIKKNYMLAHDFLQIISMCESV